MGESRGGWYVGESWGRGKSKVGWYAGDNRAREKKVGEMEV